MVRATKNLVLWIGSLSLATGCFNAQEDRDGLDTDAETLATDDSGGSSGLTTGASATAGPSDSADGADESDSGAAGESDSGGADTGTPEDPEAPGLLFTLGNPAGSNTVVMFSRGPDGMLDRIGEFATGGMGSGGGLGSQGSIAIDEDFLYVVNAGDDTISSMRIYDDHVALVDVADAGGVRPTSLTVVGSVVYVMNADGAGGVTGFRAEEGWLTPLPGATQPLSGAETTAPAQIGATPDGGAIVVTERATDQIVTFTVGADGGLGGPVVNPSEGQTPFGFAFTSGGSFVVSEAFGGGANPGASAASSYRVADGGALWTYSSSIPSGQTAACWISIVGDKFAYTTNTASNTVSAYEITGDGDIELFANGGVVADFGDDHGPIDMVGADDEFLYVLNAGADEIVAFQVEADGRLTEIGARTDIPEFAVGLAGY
jgi:hypothetical protein